MAGVRVKRVGLVGAGHIAQSHIRAAKELSDRVAVVAVAEVDKSRLASFASEHDIPGRYEDVQPMLSAENLDLVIICTPPHLHAAQISTCLLSGTWVLCEKPICGSLGELDALEAAEAASGARCSSVFQWRCGERVERLKRLIKSQGFGRTLLASCATTWYRDQGYYTVPWRGVWATELGGPTVGAGIHFMDLVLWLLGDWQEVVALVGTLDRDIELEDVSMAVVRLASGAMLSIVNSVLSPRQETALRFDFSKATVELHCLYSYEDNDWTYTPLLGAELGATNDVWLPESAPVDRHALQLAGLLDAMEGKREVSPSLVDIRPTYDLITSVYKAAATKAAVRRGSIVPGDPFYEHFGGTFLPSGNGRSFEQSDNNKRAVL